MLLLNTLNIWLLEASISTRSIFLCSAILLSMLEKTVRLTTLFLCKNMKVPRQPANVSNLAQALSLNQLCRKLISAFAVQAEIISAYTVHYLEVNSALSGQFQDPQHLGQHPFKKQVLKSRQFKDNSRDLSNAEINFMLGKIESHKKYTAIVFFSP